MKISLSLLSVGMIAAAATAADRNYDVLDYVGNAIHQDNGAAYSAFKASIYGDGERSDLLFSTGFDPYVTGVVCTDLTGATMGQDMWSQYQTGSGNRWGIVTVTGGKALKGTWGTATVAGSYSYLWQDNAQSGYQGFTNGHSFEANFDLTRYSNTVSTNKGQTQLRTYDSSGTQTTMGFIMDHYATGTMPSIRGLAYLNTGSAASTGTYAFTLATGSSVTQAGTHSYYTAYDIVTGVVYWGWDIALGTAGANYYFDPTASGYIGAAGQAGVNEVDFLNNRNSSTTAGSMNLDNIALYSYLIDFNDIDGDGIPNATDNCPSVANPTQADCNGNGVGDACELDCNHNGRADVCEILSGAVTDQNLNGIPDICEVSSVSGVVPVSGASTGGTAVKIIGTNFFSALPVSVTFGGAPATDVVVVSFTEIRAVTPAGTPGMAVVTVNSASSESFYYRPTCGSDLDNSGVVDSGDISIVLLDFGSCSDSLTTPQEQEPLIFQTVETPTPVLNKK